VRTAILLTTKETSMTIHPKQRRDLLLAPVAVEIDLNLQRMRDKPAGEVEAELALELDLDTPAMSVNRDKRADLVLRQALRDVELHGWSATITDDSYRLRLDGGSVSLDIGLSPTIASYIEQGASG
jgi:hypothetical protein